MMLRVTRRHAQGQGHEGRKCFCQFSGSGQSPFKACSVAAFFLHGFKATWTHTFWIHQHSKTDLEQVIKVLHISCLYSERKPQEKSLGPGLLEVTGSRPAETYCVAQALPFPPWSCIFLSITSFIGIHATTSIYTTPTLYQVENFSHFSVKIQNKEETQISGRHCPGHFP